jgi:hypothetical protein
MRERTIWFIIGWIIAFWMFAPRDAFAAEETIIDSSNPNVIVHTNIVDVNESGAVLGTKLRKYDFSKSRFPIFEDEKCTEECRDPEVVTGIANYIRSKNKNVDAIQIATWLTQAKALYGPDVPLEAAVPIIWRESTFKCKARNHLNCIGFFQWMHRYHAAPMRKIGLDIYNPNDNITYFFIHVQADLDAGRSLNSALQPWEVWTNTKYKAKAEYHRLLKEGWPDA